MELHNSMLKELVKTDFKLKYKRSILGFVWSFLKPLMIILVLLAVFSYVNNQLIPKYPFYLILGVITWDFFSSAIVRGQESLTTNSQMLSKMKLPRELFVQSAVITELITFIIYLLLYIGLLFLTDAPSNVAFLIIIPILEIYAVSYYGALALSVLFVKFRDLRYIIALVLQLGFFLTPIFYSLEQLPSILVKLLTLNPVARAMIELRELLLYDAIPDLSWFAVSILIVVTFRIICIQVFKKNNLRIVEEL